MKSEVMDKGALEWTMRVLDLSVGGEHSVPIYEYICQNCGARFEKLVRGMSSTASVECPECQSKEVEKAFSVFGMGRSSSGASLGASVASCTTGST